MELIIINGPNLNLLGRREPEIYGEDTFEDFLLHLQGLFPSVSLHYFQSNHEGEIIDKLHEVGFDSYDGVILNAGGYTHTSVAMGDAIAAINTPVIEVHISNIFAREPFRHHSYVGLAAARTVEGHGANSYLIALDAVAEL